MQSSFLTSGLRFCSSKNKLTMILTGDHVNGCYNCEAGLYSIWDGVYYTVQLQKLSCQKKSYCNLTVVTCTVMLFDIS